MNFLTAALKVWMAEWVEVMTIRALNQVFRERIQLEQELIPLSRMVFVKELTQFKLTLRDKQVLCRDLLLRLDQSRNTNVLSNFY
jgi:hypothetical protein